VPAGDLNAHGRRTREWGSALTASKIFGVSPKSLTDLAALTRDNPTMRTVAVIFVLALITIAFEIYSDAALTSAEVSHTAAPDPATAAIAHGLKQLALRSRLPGRMRSRCRRS